MRSNNIKSVLIKSGLAAGILLFGGGAAFAQQVVNLVARPSTATMPDGTSVPMWGYTCVTAAAVPLAGPQNCRSLNPQALPGAWSPVVITVPTGQTLTIKLTNNLSFANGNTVPTSITIVGQLGGGLGSVTASCNPSSTSTVGSACTPSPAHGAQATTWPVAAAPGVQNIPPPQGPRVQSFATEVAAGSTTALTWNNLNPGTYLIESGTHPSIQGPMGLYGILVVTAAPTSSGTAPATTETGVGCAYLSATAGTCAVPYDAEVPILLSEIDPVQNNEVSTAVNTAGFNELTVWSGQPGGCGNPASPVGVINTCYPPAVNYLPLYYMMNGVAFNRTSASNSLFPVSPATLAPSAGTGTATGNVLVRFVNAGLRMHVPAIVGSQTGVAPSGGTVIPTGFSLIAEDGNPLPGIPRVQSEVFMAAGKTYDVMINGPAPCTAVSPATTCAPPALAVYDRQLSLSGNAIDRDAGMLAYIGINGGALPAAVGPGGASAFQAAHAINDTYPSLLAGQSFSVSDPSKGVIANDINVYGVALLTQATNGVVALNANGTFTYTANSGSTANTDSFTYCANGTVSGGVCSSGITATVNLNTAAVEGSGGITLKPMTYTSTVSSYLSIAPPGVLSLDTDAAGYPLSVVVPTAGIALTPSAGTAGSGTLAVNPNGGFNAAVTAPGTYTFTYNAQNTQGTQSANPATVTLVFPAGSNLAVTIVDGSGNVLPSNPATGQQDYRWVIEEDRTFYVDPRCTQNPPPTGLTPPCPTGSGGAVQPTYGVNFHTSYMPFVAQGCTGPLSCEGGQTVIDPTSGQHVLAVCDLGNGACRPDPTNGNGHAPVLPGQVALDPTKRYYISILPGDAAAPFISGCTSDPTQVATCVGHGMGGGPIAAGQTSVKILSQASPYQPGRLSVQVFEDDFPLNGEQDAGGGIDVLAPNEPGLGNFNIQLWDPMGANGDFTGQMTYDMFNQPLTNGLDGTIDPVTGLDACAVTKQGLLQTATAGGITGMIVTCPKYEGDGSAQILSPLAGQAIINNLMQGRFEVIATPGADRIARGEEWLQTNTLDGQKAHDTFIKIGEPAYFQEFGPASYHAVIGFANPAIINARLAGICNGSDLNGPSPGTTLNCSNTVTGTVTTERMSRVPDERLYSSGNHSSFYWTQCYVSLGDPDGEDFAFTKCDANGKFTLKGLPPGTWRVTVFDQWNDMLVDGLSTPVAIVGPSQTVNMGDIATNQWQINLYTRTFIDDNKDGISQSTENGIPFINTTVRYRDGSLGNNLGTDFTGTANFNETFPLFNWYVVETDVTRYKNTGTHVVYDSGGPADGTPACGDGKNGYPPCGGSVIGANLANTAEPISLPINLRVPGSVYCASADCTGKSIDAAETGAGTSSASDSPSSCTASVSGPAGFSYSCSTLLSTGRIDSPWLGGTEGWQGYSGQNNFLEFGKEPYVPGENGGIKGHVIYASTRPFDDPQMLVQTQWEPLIPHVTINLYQEGTAADGVTPTLTLVDTTQTSSFDDWAQGFRADGVTPNMNCPGQSTQDLFYFTIFNQPNYLNVYNAAHGGPAVTPLPYNSQYKCYDGMHNWNQLQPTPYDGMYKFPSVTATDANGKPTATGTNCTICTPNHAVDANDLYYGIPQLPAGKYVVEVVVPPGFELVKEEDKNILIGDNYIAPAVQEFGALGNIFIIPDQASVASAYTASGVGYNANNAQNPTQNLGAAPNNGIVPGFVPEPTWPCVGQARIVPDYISLYPQSKQVAPFAGATRHLCDRKEVTLGDQMGAIAKFYVYTSTHIASKFTGVITDDFTSEFDPFSPQFGEKFSPPNMPVSVKDWNGNEVSRVYSDQWGTYNGMTYSTWEVNPPNPTGYSPTMMVFCMNDPGTGSTAGKPADPLFNPAYSQFCYELPFMPGTTQYLDTPVVPTAAFAGAGYNNVDCAYPTLTPAVASVLNTAAESNVSGTLAALTGPWVAGASGSPIASVTLLTDGSGYTGVPTVNFTGGGSGAVATPFMGVGSVTIGGGFGGGGTYSSTPTVAFAAPPCTINGTTCVQATGTAVMNTNIGANRRVTGVTIGTAGSGYTSRPTITFSGGGCTRNSCEASATASLKVVSLTLTAGGSAYSTAAVSFSGGGSFGTTQATASATLGAIVAHSITINALGDQAVNNYGYSGPQATTAPFNAKTVTRHYGFGSAPGTVTIGGVTAPVTAWSDTQITANVPGGVSACAIQQQTQYQGSPAQCGELVIKAATGQQSVDAVTVTIGGKAPTVVTSTTPLTQYGGAGAIQQAIDHALPGDLIIIPPGVYQEMLLMWKPVRLQGVGAASSVINANTQPAGKFDPWRLQLNCLFGLKPDGTPITSGSCAGTNWQGFAGVAQNPQIDRLPLEGIVGWDTTTNGNLAQLLSEPTLMGAYEGAGITVLAKGVDSHGAAGYYGSGSEAAFPTGTTVLTAASCGPNSATATNPFPSNFWCNPSSIDGLAITDSSQGGGGIFVHAWAHNLQIANNRVYNNIGTLSGGINVGQGESPDAYLAGSTADSDPGSCQTSNTTNLQLPYCFDLNVNVHHNMVWSNTSIGDELFSGTPTGAGGVSFCTGADYYKFNYNWVCGNSSTGDGGGLAHVGFIWNGDIEHNQIIFNQSTNPSISTNGAGIVIMGAAPDGFTAAGVECGSVVDVDCAPGLPDGTGPNLVINANLIMGNAAESGSGGGIRLQSVNGTEVSLFPSNSSNWNSVTVTNNIIANNVAGWDGAGISLQDALKVSIINNTIMSNDTTASAGVLFNTLGAPLASAPGATNQTTSSTTSAPQPAGVVSMVNSSNLTATFAGLNITCPANNYAGSGSTAARNGTCTKISYPYLANDVFWQNRAFYIGVGSLSSAYQQNIVALFNAISGTPAANQPVAEATAPNGNGTIVTGGTGACTPGATYWDVGVRGDKGPGDHSSGYTLAPVYSVMTNVAEAGGGSQNNLLANPTAVSQYCNGSRFPPEAGTSAAGWQVPPGVADATVPNPIFGLTPNATVDEGNNWVNISWGPLAETNPVTGGTLGNYALASGSPAIDYIPTGASSYSAAPGTDFFGNPRPDATHTGIDVGAVEFQGTSTALPYVTPAVLNFFDVNMGASATQTLTLNGGGSGVTVTGTSIAYTSGTTGFTVVTGTGHGSCATTGNIVVGAGGNCTIVVQFAPTTATAGQANATLTLASSGPIDGNPVALSGTGVVPTVTASVSGGPLAFGNQVTGYASAPMTLTVINTGNTALAGGAFTFGGGTPQPFSRPTGTAGGTCTAALAVGASCTINVVFTPATLATFSRTLTVVYTGATVTGSPVTLTGAGAPPATVSISAPTITLATGTRTGTGLVTLTNSAAAGAASVTVTSIATSQPAGTRLQYMFSNGALAGPDGCTGTTLAPQASCTVSVRFTNLLGATGVNRAGTITFTDDGAASPQSTALTGYATP